MFEELIQPAKIYTGWDESKIPIKNIKRVEDFFGKKTTEKLIELKNEFFEYKVFKRQYEKENKKVDWNLMKKNVTSAFLAKYPQCCQELIEIFWWTYSFFVWKEGQIY